MTTQGVISRAAAMAGGDFSAIRWPSASFIRPHVAVARRRARKSYRAIASAAATRRRVETTNAASAAPAAIPAVRCRRRYRREWGPFGGGATVMRDLQVECDRATSETAQLVGSIASVQASLAVR